MIILLPAAAPVLGPLFLMVVCFASLVILTLCGVNVDTWYGIILFIILSLVVAVGIIIVLLFLLSLIVD